MVADFRLLFWGKPWGNLAQFWLAQSPCHVRQSSGGERESEGEHYGENVAATEGLYGCLKQQFLGFPDPSQFKLYYWKIKQLEASISINCLTSDSSIESFYSSFYNRSFSVVFSGHNFFWCTTGFNPRSSHFQFICCHWIKLFLQNITDIHCLANNTWFH